MQLLGLADREKFLNNYLNPATKDGFVRLLYPDNPRHPRQKYLLTVKGITALGELQKTNNAVNLLSANRQEQRNLADIA